jgi:molecular chaperone DnaK (HSP70)
MKQKRSRYIIGIDLGTTNSAIAYMDTRRNPTGGADAIRTFSVPQLVAEGEVKEREGLPSFLYLSTGQDLPAGSLDLAWAKERNFAVGEFARIQGAKVPGRLVSSAKSWLCHQGVDRKAPILPWGSDMEELSKCSPVDASALYLGHVRDAWNYLTPGSDTADKFEKQDVILTVPASFDAVARELTLDAAKKAGITRITLVEEPQAAFYSWISDNEENWSGIVGPGKIILVCDIGGGTTDFTLIRVREGDAAPTPERIAVGEHLLLGGGQHGPGPGPSGRIKDTRRKGKSSRFSQVAYPCLPLPERKRKNPVRRRRSTGSHQSAGTRQGNSGRDTV